MSSEQPLTSQLYITLEGSDVPDSVMANVAEVIVDQNVHLPDMFTIRLYDPGLKMLNEGPFDLTKTVSISASTGDDDRRIPLIEGEITALEPVFEDGMVAQLVVRGYDKSHRLFRETKSQAFLNKKDSDLANEIARAAGLQTQVDTTSTVYDHIYQHNQSDLSFLMQRAWRIGYECYVTEGKLHFHRPTASSAAVTLAWGQDLISFRPRMTLAEQVDEVLVKGWDVEKQAAIVGKADQGNLNPAINEPKDGAEWAGNFGAGKLVIVNQPVVSQAEADLLAAARLDELSGAFIEAEGLAFRRPDIRAGEKVKLEELGTRLSGEYLVTSATHTYGATGLSTTFMARGSRTGLLTEQMDRSKPTMCWPGTVTAVVTNTDDPNDWGRVKVKFPWMSGDAESDWARVVSVGAGPEAGLFVLPDVDDEVLVAFEHGDFSRPYVLGGMWNGQHKVPPTVTGAGTGEKPLIRSWHSRTGHHITMYENSDKKVEIVTKDGHTIRLDDSNTRLEIISKGGLKITLDDSSSKIAVEGGGDIEIKATGSMKLEAGANMDIKASGQVNIQGSMVNLN